MESTFLDYVAPRFWYLLLLAMSSGLFVAIILLRLGRRLSPSDRARLGKITAAWHMLLTTISLILLIVLVALAVKT